MYDEKREQRINFSLHYDYSSNREEPFRTFINEIVRKNHPREEISSWFLNERCKSIDDGGKSLQNNYERNMLHNHVQNNDW
jgi:hypothetical protein